MAKQSDDYFRPRPIEGQEFIALFELLVARLDRHIIAVGNAERGARDDLAAVLRTLVNRDRGNDAIARFCEITKTPEPVVALTKANLDQHGLLLHIAGLPEDESKDLNTTIPSGLRATICLVKADKDKLRKFTWDDVIDAYGNTVGAHLGQNVPRILDEVRLHGFGDTDFGSYMLRSIGVKISNVCHALLKAHNPQHESVSHDSFFQGISVTVVNFRFDGKQHSLEAKAARQNWKAAGPLVSVVDQTGTEFVFGTKDGGYFFLTTIKREKKL